MHLILASAPVNPTPAPEDVLRDTAQTAIEGAQIIGGTIAILIGGLFAIAVLSLMYDAHKDGRRQAEEHRVTTELTRKTRQMPVHRVVDIELDHSRINKNLPYSSAYTAGRLVLDEDGIRIPVDAPLPLVLHVKAFRELNGDGVVRLRADVDPVELCIDQYGYFGVTPPDDAAASEYHVTPEGTHRIVDLHLVTGNDQTLTFLVVQEGAARIPVTGSSELVDSISRLRRANPDGIDILVDGDIDTRTLRMTDIRGIRAAKPSRD